MKSYFLATKLNTHGSILSTLGKGMIIIGRVTLGLSLFVFILLVLMMPFIQSDGMSGVPLGVGFFAWLFFEFIGSVAFHIGQVGTKKAITNENTPNKSLHTDARKARAREFYR